MGEVDLKAAMTWLGLQPDTLFLGQGVGYSGTKLSESFEGVPAEKRIEFPVAENLQLGVSIGLALEGFVPVSIFPRLNFLLCAMDQLVNHLDKLPIYSDRGYAPKVIIRTAVGAKQPLDAGPQHTGDCSLALETMLQTIQVCRMRNHYRIQQPVSNPLLMRSSPLEVYQAAYLCKTPTLIVEG